MANAANENEIPEDNVANENEIPEDNVANENARPVVNVANENARPEDPTLNWYAFYRFRPGRDSPSDARNALLVVAALIAAITFQAGVTPPGGVWQETKNENKAGQAILGTSKAAYSTFLMCNTLAFSASLNVITYLVLGCPFQLEILMAIYAMSATYGASIAATQPDGVLKGYYMWIAFLGPYILRYSVTLDVYFIIHLYFEKESGMADISNEKPEDISKGWYRYYRFKPERDSPSDARNTLLVVATLTYQTGVNPPGGVWQEPGNNPNVQAGKAILAKNSGSYTLYLLSNSLAFSSSLSIIISLVIGCPFQMEVMTAIGAMNFTYGSSISAVHPEGSVRWEYIYAAMAFPWLLRVVMEIIKLMKRK